MGLTNFPNGISSFGVPVIGTTVPFGPLSKSFFVDGAVGSDGNSGISSGRPLKTVSKAHSLCTAGRNDVVYLMGNGSISGSVLETATIAWSKNATHLIGVAAPGLVAQRARIASAAATDATPIMTVSADGCLFSGLHIVQDFSTSATNVSVDVTGQRNVFQRCHIAGGGHATGADNAGMRSLKISGSGGNGEHLFEDCVIGLDSIPRGAASSAEMEIDGASPRNIFRRCLFVARTDAAAHDMVLINSGGIDRYVIFEDCIFWNDIVGGGTNMDELLNIHSAAGGDLLMMNCVMKGATAIETGSSGRVFKSQEADMVADAI